MKLAKKFQKEAKRIILKDLILNKELKKLNQIIKILNKWNINQIMNNFKKIMN